MYIFFAFIDDSIASINLARHPLSVIEVKREREREREPLGEWRLSVTGHGISIAVPDSNNSH